MESLPLATGGSPQIPELSLSKTNFWQRDWFHRSLSKNPSPDVPKNASFLLKNYKNRRSLSAWHPEIHLAPTAGGLPFQKKSVSYLLTAKLTSQMLIAAFGCD